MRRLSPAGHEALEWANDQLATTPHRELTLSYTARRGDRSSAQPPSALHNAFGSHQAFHALLAARQWQQATNGLNTSDGSPLGLAMADITFAIENPHRFRLMYAPELWDLAREAARAPTLAPTKAQSRRLLLEAEAVLAMEEAREANYLPFWYALGGQVNENRVRLVTSLVTGLSFEFVNEQLFQGDKARQLDHAEELLRIVIDK